MVSGQPGDVGHTAWLDFVYQPAESGRRKGRGEEGGGVRSEEG